LHVVNTVDVPRGGWRFTVVETGVTVSAGSISSLKRDVRNHLAANQVAVPPDLDAVIEDSACHNLGDSKAHWCQEVPDPKQGETRQSSRWRASEVLRFLRSVVSWGAKHGFQFVPPEEAERRAAICAWCPLNVPVKGCLGCSGVSVLVRSIRGKQHKTSVDEQLNVCDACGCELKVKVLVPTEALDSSGVDYPAWCWQRPSAEEPPD
jgi:hypothetical protein